MFELGLKIEILKAYKQCYPSSSHLNDTVMVSLKRRLRGLGSHPRDEH